jgi:DNA-binding MarR family transcriptional regulator
MSSAASRTPAVGALLRYAWQQLRDDIYRGVVAEGFDDLRPAHVAIFRHPSMDGRRPTEVAAETGLTRQSINDLLRHLETHGYLELESDPRDERARLIRLTERGRKVDETAARLSRETGRRWARAIGAKRFRELEATLREIATIEGRDVRT